MGKWETYNFNFFDKIDQVKASSYENGKKNDMFPCNNCRLIYFFKEPQALTNSNRLQVIVL